MDKAKSSPDQQTDDAEFLTREFGITTTEASELVARDGMPPSDLKARIEAPDGSPILPDPLAGVPTPSGPPTELTTDADEQARKPVIHRHNDTQGAG